MPEHVLHPGLRVIDAIAELGKCLGYEVERERSVGLRGAAVDLAWYAAGDKWMPLMIFEVESKASSGMANNAMKVLSRDVDDFVKPLFLFHVVLKGSAANERISNLRRQWGSHNYRVYTLGLNGEVQRLVVDILSQHRRVTKQVDVESVSATLAKDSWESVDQLAVLSKLKNLNFSGDYLGGLARVSLRDPSLTSLYLDSLESIHLCGEDMSGRYGGFIGDYIPGLLEISMLIASGRITDAEGPRRLEEWQERSGYGMRTIGPYFGLSRDYDSFVLGVAPFVYGMAGMLLRGCSQSYQWLTMDLQSIVAGEQKREIADFAVLPGALWLIHISASGLCVLPSKSRVDGDLKSAFEFARALVNGYGGVPDDVLDSPPDYVDVHDENVTEEWLERLQGERAMVPELEEFNLRYSVDGEYSGIGMEDAMRDSMKMLMAADWRRESVYQFVSELRKLPR
ncbi:hypothetical protein [Streptomyces sp. Root1310]|uniref:hypothetical protein n=1 Tax=Streptomyces sp. Root1310 TaxID=1736452 RepID=UPI000A53A0E4|nr:hypothetical protein [Streptomyces sp. Root1310]